MDRVILHVDMNAFYASVETLNHPEARGVPMAVCGDAESRRGIILAKNELAKQRGVKTAEPVWQAQRKCPGLLLLPPHHELYRAYSKRANAIYERYTDLVEAASIDESYLDVTGSRALFGSGRQIADQIRAQVREELGLTVSVGVSFCKLFAKMGSDYKKPDATTEITRENYPALLYPLPIGDLISVGAATARVLQDMGVRTIGDLAAASEQKLSARLGKHGRMLYKYVHGLDDRPVLPPDQQEEAKSIGNSITYKRDLRSLEDIRVGLLPLAELVAQRLRAAGMKCRGVQVAIKDARLKTIDRQQQLPCATHLAKELYESALGLVLKSWAVGEPIRLISLTAINLVPGGEEQLSLFAEPSEETMRQEALEQSLDRIRERFGKGAVRPASIIKNDLGVR